jgi:hypothetical protein
MAATHTAQEAFDLAKLFVRKMPVDDATLTSVKFNILTNALAMVWMARPWRWTIGSVTNLTIVANQQDYTQAPPGDFLYTQLAYITDGEKGQVLTVAPALPTTEVIAAGWPTMISYQGSNTWRLFPKPGNQGGSTVNVVQLYKKTAPLIASGNIGSAGALVQDDEWFWVYCECVLYWAFKYGFDTREGAAQFTLDERKAVLGGQHAKAMAAIEEMAQREPLDWETVLLREARAKRT